MRIEDQSNVLTVEFVSAHHGYASLNIEVASRGFKGHNESVSVELFDLEDFMQALTTLEKTRQGKAVLESVNKLPDHRELHLECYSLDKLGHIGLTIELLRIRYIGSHYVPFKVSVAFEIEPSNLPYLVSEFAGLLTFIRNNPG
jgi:hypothetical protein